MSIDEERRGSEPFVEDSFVLENPRYGLDVLSELNALREEGSFTDAILCVGSKEFPCHRNVLAVSSPYFKAMFSNDLKESRDIRIKFKEVSSYVMLRIIDYAYTGKLEITVDNAQDMLAAGSLFVYPKIVDACSQFLFKHLHPSNSLGIEQFAHLHTCTKLETDAHQYTLENFSSVVECDEFLQVPLERLLTYIQSDLIDVRNEEIVYESAVRWIQAEPATRAPHFCTFLEHIRLRTIDVHYLDDVMHLDPHLRDCDICMNRVDDARRYHETKTEERGQRRRSMQTDSLLPRPSTVARDVIVVLGGMNKINYILQSMEMYDPQKDKWLPLPDMPQPVSWFSAAAVDNDIYVTGGILDGHIVPNVWRFESVKRRWSAVTPMLSPRARHASAVWNGKLYVVGGINLMGNSKINSVERIDCYDPVKNAWQEVGDSPLPRKQSHMVTYKHTLVEVGGTKGGIPEDTMESYICSDSSIIYSGEQYKLPDSIQFSQITLLNGVFYIVWEDSKKVISLNPDRRTFHRLADLSHTHIHSGAVVANGKLYVVGGLEDSKSTRCAETYDPAVDVWKPVKPMRHARACHGCVNIRMC